MAWISIATQLILGWMYGHIVEYSVHRWAFHTFGKRKTSVLSYHVHEHHKTCRQNAMYDVAYKQIKPTEETYGLLFLALAHLPIVFFFPAFYVAIAYSVCSYYIVHRYAHMNPSWCRKKLSHHYDHHMGPARCSNANWGVRSGVVDRIMGTRVKYYGTIREKREWNKRTLRILRFRHRLQRAKMKRLNKQKSDDKLK